MSSVSKRNIVIIAALFLALLLFVMWGGDDADDRAQIPRDPETSLKLLKEGNERFVKDASIHPRSDTIQLELAGKEDPGKFAFATILASSDSRVPVTTIFDAGIMDLYVVRTAGPTVQAAEAGSLEMALTQGGTPLLVVLGNTQCAAVSTVIDIAEGASPQLTPNMVAALAPIRPAVERTLKHSGLKGRDALPLAIEQNVWQAITDLFARSPLIRELVKNGKVTVVGAIYNVGTGKIEWLKNDKAIDLLKQVEAALKTTKPAPVPPRAPANIPKQADPAAAQTPAQRMSQEELRALAQHAAEAAKAAKIAAEAAAKAVRDMEAASGQ